MMERRVLYLTVGGILLLGLVVAPSATAQEEEPLDSSICAACHDDRVTAFEANPHALLNDPEWGRYGVEGGSCISCHAGAETHVGEGGGTGNILAFGEGSTAQARTEACMECHTDTHPRFASSQHAQAGVDCTSCHSIHQEDVHSSVALLKSAPMTAADPADELGPRSRVCAECHGDVATRFEFNERHRLQEGILDCTSCHNPHEVANRARLGGFKHQEVCLDCHTDKGGPFVFEHASSRVEGCTACHVPHGAPNRHLLKFQNLGELCYSCHVEVPGFHLTSPTDPRFGLDANCTNCHSAIHGSNFHPFFLQ